MGFFSWKTSDTGKSIPNCYSKRKTFTVYMVTSDGRVFTEYMYGGYGVFGGKDIYVLIAELNNLPGESDDEKRSNAINLVYETHIRKDGCSYKQGTGKDYDFFNWETPLPSEGGKTPNQLVEEGWEIYYPNGYGEWNQSSKTIQE